MKAETQTRAEVKREIQREVAETVDRMLVAPLRDRMMRRQKVKAETLKAEGASWPNWPFLGVAMLLFALCTGRAATVYSTLKDIGLTNKATSLTFTPTNLVLITTGGLQIGPPLTISSAATGFSLTLDAGDYWVKLPLIPTRSAFHIAVPDSTNSYNITSLLSAPLSYVHSNWNVVVAVASNNAAISTTATQLNFVGATAVSNIGNSTVIVLPAGGSGSGETYSNYPTTLGQSWSKTNAAGVQTNGDFVLTSPASYRKKVLVFGSSVALGSGATGNQGWAYQLEAVLTNRGYTFRNHSIAGNTTANLLARFYTDVVPEKPDFVVIALSLYNEGIIGGGETVYTTYVTNMHRLIGMIRQAGAIPIVAGCYPNGAYTATEYEYIKQFNDQMEAEGVMVLNFLGATDDGAGQWISSLEYDANHPNDLGHAEMFYSIPSTLFDVLQDYADNLRPSQGGGVLFNTNVSGYLKPLDLLPVQTFSSFSVAVRVRASQTGLHHGLIGFGSGGARVRAPDGWLAYANQAGQDISSAVTLNDLTWHQIVVAYNHARSWVDFYIDGVLVGGTNESYGGSLITNICFLGRADVSASNPYWCEFKDALVYRTALTSNQVKQVYSGYYPRAALELYAPLSDKSFTANKRLVNLAPTTSYLQVASSAAPVLLPVDADVFFGDVRGRILSGNGNLLTSLNGANISAGTVSTGALTSAAFDILYRDWETNAALANEITNKNRIRTKGLLVHGDVIVASDGGNVQISSGGSFIGSGANLTDVPATALTGTLPDARFATGSVMTTLTIYGDAYRTNYMVVGPGYIIFTNTVSGKGGNITLGSASTLTMSTHVVAGGDVTAGATSAIKFLNRGEFKAMPGNGHISFMNAANNGFGSITWGPADGGAAAGTSNQNFPAIVFRYGTNASPISGGPALATAASTNQNIATDFFLSGAVVATNGVYEREGLFAGPTNQVTLTSNYTYSVVSDWRVTNLLGNVAGLVGSTTIAWSNNIGSNCTLTVALTNATAWSAVCTNGKVGSLSIRGGAYPRIGFEQDP